MILFLLGVLVALGSASAYSVGVMLQSLEARGVPATESLRVALLKQLVMRRRWVIGTLCVVLGWALQTVALALAPLTVVQPALAVGLFVLLIAGARLSDEPITKREIVAVMAITVGVAGLGFASPKNAGGGHAAPLVIAPALAAFAVVALTPYLMRARVHFAMVVLGAGVAYAASAFMSKFVADAFARMELLPAAAWLAGTICAAGLGLTSEMTALQKRSAIGVFPGVLVTQIVLTVLLAPLLAGETWSADPVLLLVLGLSLAILAAGTAVLASCGAVTAMVAAEGTGEASGQPLAAAANAGCDGGRGGPRALHAAGAVRADGRDGRG